MAEKAPFIYVEGTPTPINSPGIAHQRHNSRLYKPASDWLEMLPLHSSGLNM